MSSPSRHSVLVISQVYVPDSPAVGQHLADVAEELTRRGWDARVLTSARGYDDPSIAFPRSENRNGVGIRRLPLSSFGKSSIAVRLIAQSLFLIQAFLLGVGMRRPSVILASTSPPMAGFVAAALARLRGVPLVWWVMDLNPDQMVSIGKIAAGSVPARIFDWMNRYALKRARSVIVLDEFMRDRVLRKLPVAEKTRVVPPWAPPDAAAETTATGESFRKRHGLHNAFIIMYAGNHSPQHPLNTLLDAARTLRHDDRLRFVFVGGGIGKSEVEAAIAEGLENVLSLPYQRLEDVPDMLAAADVHAVSIGDASVGIVHPCKLYGIIAAGKPTLLLAPAECYAAPLFAAHPIGWHVRHGDTEHAAAAIRAAAADRADTLARGRAARRLSNDAYSRQRLVAAVCDVIAAATAP